MWAKVGDIISGVEGTVEDKLSRLWAVFTGEADNMKRAAAEKYDQVRGKVDQGKRGAEEKGEHAKQGVEQMYEECKRKAGETVGEGKRKVGEMYDEGRRGICESCDECKRRALEAYELGKGGAEQKIEAVEHEAGRKYTEAEKAYEAGKERVYERGQEAKEVVGDKVKYAGEKIKGEKGKGKGVKEEL